MAHSRVAQILSAQRMILREGAISRHRRWAPRVNRSEQALNQHQA
jgi:hypothetical protein